MRHRKISHLDIIKKCKFFKEGYCAYEPDVCWFRHDDLITENAFNPQEDQQENFICRFCEKAFNKKSEFMVHKKTHHEKTVPKCREYQTGNCVHSKNECWYRHEEISFVYETESPSDSVFQEAPEDHQPPDMMIRLMDMMEELFKKVQKLEKSSPTQERMAI